MREYVPGDDRRHIHWKSSAKLDKLMVRQFVDSRRSHLGLVLSTNPNDYADAEEFELAVSVIGSLGRSALLEDQAVTATTGHRPLPSHGPTPLLDALAGVEQSERRTDISSLVKRALPVVRGASVVALVAGSAVSPGELRQAAQRFHHDVRILGVRVKPGAEVTLQTIGSTSVHGKRGSPDPADGRQTLLTLTDSCRTWIAASRAAREDWLARTIETRLTPDEVTELNHAVALLKRLAQ